MSNSQPRTCDIFCAVVDNYGDIGVCWRLARQLANEHGVSVRLWVDDLHSFGKLCPELDAGLEVQRCRGVQVMRWDTDSSPPLPQPLWMKQLAIRLGCKKPQPSRWLSRKRARGVADLVIEAFACKLPESYIEAMAAQEQKPVWVNLEYLSAEDWVEGCHKLPSPHPALPLIKYFFFPGFTEKTGGLLLERDLLARRDAFQSDAMAQASPTPALPRREITSDLPACGLSRMASSSIREFWQSLGVPERVAGELRVSLFGYENEAMESLLSAWEQGGQPVTCLLPEGRSLPQVKQYFENVGRDLSRHGGCVGINPDLQSYSRGNLRVHVLPFVEQERYDELLWACDINFVRGEDSCVRAQWAARPFIWQIYPQHDGVQLRHGAAEPSGAGATALRPLPQSAGFASNVSGVHLEKLEALRVRYTAGLSADAAQAVRDLWGAWNGGNDVAAAWQAFVAQRMALQCHGVDWAQRLSSNNLALNLLDFFRQTE